MDITGQLVNIRERRIGPARVRIESGRITAVEPLSSAPNQYILPGFIDSHIHIESSLLVPSEFARVAVRFGTVGTVSDPHEIANVLGLAGVRFMIDNAATTPLKIAFGAPSCVPATPFETAGASLDADSISELFNKDRLLYLAEMMNYPGVVCKDPVVMAKIAVARQLGRPIDGHAPGLSGQPLADYVGAGISTDHECTTLAEALEKIALGMKILIREGSAARNFAALAPLIASHPQAVMFCSDDRHPDTLIEGHIDVLVRRALADGYDLFDVLRCACLNPIEHYGLPIGRLQIGDPADFIIVEDLAHFTVKQTFIDGEAVYDEGECTFERAPVHPINHFATKLKNLADLTIPAQSDSIKVIEAIEGQLITTQGIEKALVVNGQAVADPKRDILKLAVVNRYSDQPVAKAFVRGFGLTTGAIASTVAHDCHNIVAVGANDQDLLMAINALIAFKGGLAAYAHNTAHIMPLPVAGLMSVDSAEVAAEQYTKLNEVVRGLKSPMQAPFMTLSFMALLVIPALKLSDQGLFDGEKFAFTELFVPATEQSL